jgi:DNA polymerase III epsilon subunit-like protein
VLDFETSGLDLNTGAQAIQIGGKAYHPRTLEPYPVETGGEFCSLMRPPNIEQLDTPEAKKALEINKKTKEEILAAPDQKLVWNQFVDWVNRFNTKKSKWGCPIACGKNIRDFDMKFVDQLNRLHCKNKEKTLLFSSRRTIDLEDFIHHWFENDSESLPNEKMDTLRDYFGMSHELSHDAIGDCRDTGSLIMKFLGLYRNLRARKASDGSEFIKFRNCMGGK